MTRLEFAISFGASVLRRLRIVDMMVFVVGELWDVLFPSWMLSEIYENATKNDEKPAVFVCAVEIRDLGSFPSPLSPCHIYPYPVVLVVLRTRHVTGLVSTRSTSKDLVDKKTRDTQKARDPDHSDVRQ
jgi:hypothetical protein